MGTGSSDPSLGVVSWADRCPLRRAVHNHIQQSPASLWPRLCGTLEAEGVRVLQGRDEGEAPEGLLAASAGQARSPSARQLDIVSPF